VRTTASCRTGFMTRDEPRQDAMKTQVRFIRPAGLLLSHILHLQDIESVELEMNSRDHKKPRSLALS
jgi:hypothetical protein